MPPFSAKDYLISGCDLIIMLLRSSLLVLFIIFDTEIVGSKSREFLNFRSDLSSFSAKFDLCF